MQQRLWERYGESFNPVILDVNLPDGDGFELCKKIRAAQDIPVIFLTARDLEADVMAFATLLRTYSSDNF